MKTSVAIAERTPMSRTWSARSANSPRSNSGSPNSFTSVAPGAENRSVICDVIAALSTAASRSSRPTFAPTRRAGMTNTGSSTIDATVTCHDRLNITTRVSARAIEFVTTPASAEVKARCAPMTSLLSLLTRAPVCVRWKKATGMVCMWSNTARRRSKMIPSPSREDLSRSSTPTPASRTAIAAMTAARISTVRTGSPSTIALTARPASTGEATPSAAATVASARNARIVDRRWRANRPTRRNVCQSTRRALRASDRWAELRRALQADMSVMTTRYEFK